MQSFEIRPSPKSPATDFAFMDLDGFEEFLRLVKKHGLEHLSNWQDHWEDYRFPLSDLHAVQRELSILIASPETSQRLQKVLGEMVDVASKAIERHLDVEVTSD